MCLCRDAPVHPGHVHLDQSAPEKALLEVQSALGRGLVAERELAALRAEYDKMRSAFASAEHMSALVGGAVPPETLLAPIAGKFGWAKAAELEQQVASLSATLAQKEEAAFGVKQIPKVLSAMQNCLAKLGDMTAGGVAPAFQKEPPSEYMQFACCNHVFDIRRRHC